MPSSITHRTTVCTPIVTLLMTGAGGGRAGHGRPLWQGREVRVRLFHRVVFDDAESYEWTS
jgi:hypothetical protein